MSSYRSHKFMLTQNQLMKVKKALKEDKAISLTIPEKNFNGEVPIPLTDTEMQKIHDGEGMIKVTLSKRKLQHMRDEKEGGFLSAILKLLPTASKIISGLSAADNVASGISSIASSVSKSNAESAAPEEQRRHNRAMAEGGSSSGRSGGSLQAGTGSGRNEKNSYTFGGAKCVHCGGGLLLKAKRGRGLFLRPYSRGYSSGDGIILAIASAAGRKLPSAPNWLTSIPIIGDIANIVY